MGAVRRAVSRASFGAWLIKANPRLSPVDELLATGFSTVDRWCVRATYRADLIGPGQPVLYWVSGGSKGRPAGIYARGHTTGPAVAEPSDTARVDRRPATLSMPLDLTPLSTPVLRTDLLAHPSLSQLEVLTMPAGSNPSFVTRAQQEALEEGWPELAQEAPDARRRHLMQR